jgi:hypothetical protein
MLFPTHFFFLSSPLQHLNPHEPQSSNSREPILTDQREPTMKKSLVQALKQGEVSISTRSARISVLTEEEGIETPRTHSCSLSSTTSRARVRPIFELHRLTHLHLPLHRTDLEMDFIDSLFFFSDSIWVSFISLIHCFSFSISFRVLQDLEAMIPHFSDHRRERV